MRVKVLGTLLVVVLLAAIKPVHSTTNGQPDGNGHPRVGLVIQFIPNTNLVSVCSGSALSPTRFLTAAHCADLDFINSIWSASGQHLVSIWRVPSASDEARDVTSRRDALSS